MDIEIQARVCAIELLLTHLVAEYLRSVPDAQAQATYACEQLRQSATRMPLGADSLDDEAKLRVRIKDKITEIIDTALQRTAAIPLYIRTRDPDQDAPG